MSKFRTVVSVIIMIIAGFVGFIAGEYNIKGYLTTKTRIGK